MGSAGRAVKKVTKKVVAAPFKLAGEVAGAVDKDLEGRIQGNINRYSENKNKIEKILLVILVVVPFNPFGKILLAAVEK